MKLTIICFAQKTEYEPSKGKSDSGSEDTDSDKLTDDDWTRTDGDDCRQDSMVRIVGLVVFGDFSEQDGGSFVSAMNGTMIFAFLDTVLHDWNVNVMTVMVIVMPVSVVEYYLS